MPRKPFATVFATALATSALVVGGLVSAPAQAEWSEPGQLTKYRLCRASADGGDAWRFVSKVRKYAHTRHARAGIQVYAGSDRKARWSSGWLQKGEVQVGTVRVKKSPKVRVYIWQEAGDRDSSVGTAAETIRIKPRKIRHC